MNNDNGSIRFAVELDNTKLQADAAKSRAELTSIGNTAAAQGNKMQEAFSAMNGMVGMAAMAAVASIGLIGKTILDTTAKFEKFGIVLKNTLGEVKGIDALAMLSQFAATTPFQLDEVTGAFIKMANQGFVPTREQLIKLGDLASSTGKSFDQLTEAILDAQTSEFERLKEFGIKASSSGDKVTFSFKEQKTTVENTASAIRAYILSLGDLKGVTGANALISASLTGQLSNLGDKLAAMYNKIGTDNKGILYGAIDGINTLVDHYQAVGEVLTGLIAIYGAQKVAVMAVAWAENAKAAATARAAAVETEYNLIINAQNFYMAAKARGITAEIAMQEAKALALKNVAAAEAKAASTTKASSLANPYVLAAMAVAALGFAIYKVITYQTDLEKAIAKTASQVENERDKTAQLFAQLNHATKGTDEWKKAKAAILDQYGNYLTDQQKELDNTKGIADAYTAINKGIAENIALKVKQESLNAISEKYNPRITEGTAGIHNEVKKALGADRAANVDQEIAPLIANVKVAVDEKTKADAKRELQTYLDNLREEVWGGPNSSVWGRTGNISKFSSELTASLENWKNETETVNNAFTATAQKIEAAKPDPVKTTYQAQINALKAKKAQLQKELEEIKKTPDVDPMKAVTAKQGQIDEINKKLGEKEKPEKAQTEIEKLKAAIEKANYAEKVGLTVKLDKLEKEKALKEEILKIQVAIAESTKMEPRGPGSAELAIVEAANSSKEGSAAALAKINDAEFEKVKKRTEETAKLEKEAADDQEKKAKETAGYFYDIADAADYLSRKLGDSNSELAGMLSVVANMGSQLGKLAESGFKISKSQGIGMAISGATQLIGMVVGQAAENKRVMAEYYRSVIQQQQDYNILLNDNLRLNSDIKGSIFIKDYEGKLKDGAAAFTDAQKKYNEELKKFATSEAITGKKNAISGTNILAGVGAGAALGAGIGSVVPVIGTAIGAAVGGIIGGLTGLFAKKKKDVVKPLLDVYPDLIDKNGEFNASLAKTLVDNNKVTEATKQTLNNLIQWKEAADKAKEQLKQVIADLTGGLGDDLRNALVTAFEDGTSAAKAFEGSVNKSLENIMANMIFNKAFEGAFSDLQARMEASYATTGDQSWLDDFQAFYSQSPDLIAKFNKGMADAKAAGSAAGFDLFGAGTRTASNKGIAAMSQDSADELNGRFTAIQGHTFSINEGVKILSANSGMILQHLAGIEKNTARLEGIENLTRSVSNGIDTINLKGVTLKQ